MPVSDRAAQFIPFMALTGYEDAVEETARLTDRKIDLDETQKNLLDDLIRSQKSCKKPCHQFQLGRSGILQFKKSFR